MNKDRIIKWLNPSNYGFYSVFVHVNAL